MAMPYVANQIIMVIFATVMDIILAASQLLQKILYKDLEMF